MFIYVMDTESRDKLRSLGFEFLKENDTKSMWVFINKQELNFDTVDVPSVVSDILTF